MRYLPETPETPDPSQLFFDIRQRPWSKPVITCVEETGHEYVHMSETCRGGKINLDRLRHQDQRPLLCPHFRMQRIAGPSLTLSSGPLGDSLDWPMLLLLTPVRGLTECLVTSGLRHFRALAVLVSTYATCSSSRTLRRVLSFLFPVYKTAHGET
jgi:hypothetical protein